MIIFNSLFALEIFFIQGTYCKHNKQQTPPLCRCLIITPNIVICNIVYWYICSLSHRFPPKCIQCNSVHRATTLNQQISVFILSLISSVLVDEFVPNPLPSTLQEVDVTRFFVFFSRHLLLLCALSFLCQVAFDQVYVSASV